MQPAQTPPEGTPTPPVQEDAWGLPVPAPAPSAADPELGLTADEDDPTW